jgi:hypothetical protein
LKLKLVLLFVGATFTATMSAGAVMAQHNDLVELDVVIDGQEQTLELDPADGPVQGVITSIEVVEVKIESLVAYETASGWELAPDTVVSTVGTDSPLVGMEAGDSWVIVPNESENLDG